MVSLNMCAGSGWVSTHNLSLIALAFHFFMRHVPRMNMTEKLHDIDRRAYDVGLTLSELATMARVSSATIARCRQGGATRIRSLTKLESVLDRVERERGS